jgi:NAD(P)-dependent dehydrogenase (short-subunit alcohol dehydrogenase family)
MSSTILVTGSSRGIGAAIARALAAAGHRVAVHAAHDLGAAEGVRRDLPGPGHVVVAGDLADAATCRRVVTEAVDALGGIDVLVNNAGIFVEQSILDLDYGGWARVWQDTIALNLVAPANLCWLVVDHWMSRPAGPRGGRLISVGSRGAYRGEPTAPAYGASKAGLHALTQSLAVALAPHGIVAAAVAPGFTDTEMAHRVLWGADGPAVRAQSPFGRVASAAEVAATVAWLASEAPEWVSGTVMDLNGASHLR